MNRKMRTILRSAILATLPVMAGFTVLGMGFGILLESKGYGPLWAGAMGVFVFAGSLQYLAVDLMATGAGFLTTALTALAVNARHLFYGLSMIDKYRGAGWKKPYLIFSLTDEMYSLNCAGLPKEVAPEDAHSFYFLASLFSQCYWIIGSLLGSFLGAAIPFSTEGVDFALTALYVTVFVDQWKSTRDHIPALLGLGAALICLVLFGPDNFLIPAMVLITIALALYRKKGGAVYG